MEELLLLGLIPINDVNNLKQIISIAENKYELSIKQGDQGLNIKESCLNLIATLLLIILNHNKFDELH